MSDASAADHLADLDARFEAHAEALRTHAAAVHDAVAHEADALAARLTPAPAPTPPSDP